MQKLTFGLGALALAAAAATGAYAVEHGGRHNPDANGDGVVTRAESQAHAGQMFSRLDANSDGKLDQADREARRTERRASMFAALDGDGNGQVSKAEFMDFKHEGKRGHGGHMGWRGGRGMMAKMADANNDGAVSQAEFAAGAQQRFDLMDANKDGQITKEERQAAREQMRGKWHERMHDKAES